MSMYTVPAGTLPTKEIIKAAIDDNVAASVRYNHLWNYYKGDHKIKARLKAGSLKNNQVVVNHARYITRVNTGYLVGNPVEYQANGDMNIDKIMDQYKHQRISKLDKILARDCSVFGVAYEYIYATKDNEVRSRKVDPRNCIVVQDDTMEHTELFAIIYTKVEDTKYYGVMVVDATKIDNYNTDLVAIKSTPHFFKGLPVIEYLNNEEREGDFEGVISQIDAYNTLASDRVNDKEQLVEAILMLYGIDLTADQKVDLKENRVLSGPIDSKAEFLVKMLNETDTDVLRKAIKEDIHKIGMTPDFSDQNFIGNASGVALKYKLINFEENAADKELYFKDGLLTRFERYDIYLNTLDSSVPIIPTYEIKTVFKRSLPQNDLETSQMINNLDGKVPQEMLVSQLSFVEDASKAVEDVNAEKQANLNLEAKAFGTNQPNIPPNQAPNQ